MHNVPAALLPTARWSLKLALVSAFALASVTSAWAGTVGGNVAPINTNTAVTHVSNIAIVAANNQSDVIVVSGLINNNFDGGWKLTIVSTNVGKLKRGDGGAGREILYTNIKFFHSGGGFGAGLTDPNGSKNIVTGASGGGTAGTTIFNTGSAVGAPGTATTATVDCAYALQISWSADSSLLAGEYTDTLILTLANDS